MKANGIAAPLLYTSPDQINLQLPFEIAGAAQVTLTLETKDADGQGDRNSPTANVLPTSLNAFENPADAVCPGYYPGFLKTLVLNADGTVNSCVNPAAPHSVVTFVVDGFGSGSLPQVTGQVNAAGQLLVGFYPNQPGDAVPALVSIAPLGGEVAGVYTIAAQVPDRDVAASFEFYPWGGTPVAISVGTK